MKKKLFEEFHEQHVCDVGYMVSDSCYIAHLIHYTTAGTGFLHKKAPTKFQAVSKTS